MSPEMFSELLTASGQTVYMVGLSSLFALLVGLPLGVLLAITDKKGLWPQYWLYQSLALLVNVVRSVPFIILLVAIIPLTRLLAGTSIGTTAAIVPLTVSAIPFLARIVESALSGVPYGLIEAGLAMGATPWQIIRKILLPESLALIVQGITLMVIALVGYAAMAGSIGGGGLGDFAIRYGYERFETNLMIITVVVLIIWVQLIQFAGDWLARRCQKT